MDERPPDKKAAGKNSIMGYVVVTCIDTCNVTLWFSALVNKGKKVKVRHLYSASSELFHF